METRPHTRPNLTIVVCYTDLIPVRCPSDTVALIVHSGLERFESHEIRISAFGSRFADASISLSASLDRVQLWPATLQAAPSLVYFEGE